MNRVVKSIDRMTDQLDRLLSGKKLKQSVRSELEVLRTELVEARLQAMNSITLHGMSWLLQLVSILARVSELVDKYRLH